MNSYNCKLLYLRIVTWNYNYFVGIIISYLKPYDCEKIKDYHQIKNNWNHLIINIR